MKKTLSDTEFHEFSKAAYSTHSKIQQTELGHLAPPMCKQKARFMNLEPLLNWGQMVLWQFQHPESDGRKCIQTSVLEQSSVGLKTIGTTVPMGATSRHRFSYSKITNSVWPL